MRIVITGGTGLIGRALSADLANDGHDVVVLSRYPGRDAGLPGEVRIERWDGRTAGEWSSLVDGADAVVNLAGENIAARRWSSTHKRLIRDSRLCSGGAVFAAIEAAKHKPRVVIQASGIGYYGDCGDEEVTEETAPGQDFLAQLAVEWESSTSRLQEMGVRWVAIRTGIVLSMEGGALSRMIFPVPFLNAGRFGSGRQWFPWIHIADEVEAIRFLIENEAAGGPFNLASPNPVTNAGFARSLGKQLGRPLLMPAPAPLLRVMLGEMAAALLHGQRAVPGRLLQMGYTFQFTDCDSALRNLLH
ncbi:MAG: TIGR01777 family oxidoreductase [Dehalococcoidia bacterium]|nr:MAG: TIGR01777 family oxidoreductase [Dehalococcoidia bacterium]